MRRLSAIVVIAASLMLGACHTIRFEVGSSPVSRVVHQRKAFFLWGLVPTREVDLGSLCADGTVAVREDATFGDGFLDLITLGIYSPRTSWYYCAGPTPKGPNS